MPDVAGRRRAVPVALLVAALLVSIVPSVVHRRPRRPASSASCTRSARSNPGGSYTARNSTSGAYGKYQIMPASWAAWAKLYLGSSTAPQTPANQETVAHRKVTALYNWLDAWPTVAHWWLTGSGERNQALWSSSARYYVAKIMKIYAAASDAQATVDVAAAPKPPAVGAVNMSTRRIQESNADIAYAGRWQAASYSGYSNGRVFYSERDGSTATYKFFARSLKWVGPVGSTRGKARVSVDGVVVGVVDLRRSTFRPQVTLFSRNWSKVGHHTLTIKVIGSGRPVAIDQFIISR